MPDADNSYEFGLSVARALATLSERECLVTFDRLRRDRKLNIAVRQMNLALGDPEHMAVAQEGLRRLGLEHAG